MATHDDKLHIHTLGSVQLRHVDTNEIILIPTPSTGPNDPLNWSVFLILACQFQAANTTKEHCKEILCVYHHLSRNLLVQFCSGWPFGCPRGDNNRLFWTPRPKLSLSGCQSGIFLHRTLAYGRSRESRMDTTRHKIWKKSCLHHVFCSSHSMHCLVRRCKILW